MTKRETYVRSVKLFRKSEDLFELRRETKVINVYLKKDRFRTKVGYCI